MIKNNTCAVVIPSYNEENLIYKTILGIPDFIDLIIVVNDASTDSTKVIVEAIDDKRLITINHKVNLGVGRAIISGYKSALELGASIVIVMGADNQMDPNDLLELINPIINDDADFTKGNRFLDHKVFQSMPKIRVLGNVISSILTCIGSGYYNIFDTQCGYTAIKKDLLTRLDLDNIYARYGFPSDFLFKIAQVKARVKDVKVKCLYGEENSGIKPLPYIITILSLSFKSFIKRQYRYFK